MATQSTKQELAGNLIVPSISLGNMGKIDSPKDMFEFLELIKETFGSVGVPTELLTMFAQYPSDFTLCCSGVGIALEDFDQTRENIIKTFEALTKKVGLTHQQQITMNTFESACLIAAEEREIDGPVDGENSSFTSGKSSSITGQKDGVELLDEGSGDEAVGAGEEKKPEGSPSPIEEVKISPKPKDKKKCEKFDTVRDIPLAIQRAITDQPINKSVIDDQMLNQIMVLQRADNHLIALLRQFASKCNCPPLTAALKMLAHTSSDDAVRGRTEIELAAGVACHFRETLIRTEEFFNCGRNHAEIAFDLKSNFREFVSFDLDSIKYSSVNPIIVLQSRWRLHQNHLFFYGAVVPRDEQVVQLMQLLADAPPKFKDLAIDIKKSLDQLPKKKTINGQDIINMMMQHPSMRAYKPPKPNEPRKPSKSKDKPHDVDDEEGADALANYGKPFMGSCKYCGKSGHKEADCWCKLRDDSKADKDGWSKSKPDGLKDKASNKGGKGQKGAGTKGGKGGKSDKPTVKYSKARANAATAAEDEDDEHGSETSSDESVKMSFGTVDDPTDDPTWDLIVQFDAKLHKKSSIELRKQELYLFFKNKEHRILVDQYLAQRKN